MAEKSSIFDMIGPIMIGPSSSHTAGVVRIGRVGNKMIGGTPDKAEIIFYNSFARTYEGHGSDKAILAGLMGMQTDDPDIKQAFDKAEENNLEFEFKPVGNASAHHPNTIKLILSKGDKKLELVGVSKGGGIISIRQVDGFTSNFSANSPTLIVTAEDRKGSISFISNLLAQEDVNIAEMTVSRKGKHQSACQFIEMDSAPRDITLQYLQSLKWVVNVTFLPNVDE
ncbi:L-serine ammonia-lyase, iron-sulfur-dependent subunit beta [Flammeovirga kamogawensis]|uniref:L-serine dehydratase n=1 Tax=Flammeovirga kamogawensis TaxID=373891 RepID=A0ABX8GXF1_9BACT|nr:L-serine ammonia-lyase, iron-sulfur-dependent subunit beta [Flammeovirga kamogawensis]MBB6460657.1 L-serine dehydratase [Flammeovirga kamogawensis]QWG08012.1 L-serine ammonia-lyase, iron-sulfur-dependent subunit beta [Flammeovirga kamogawensis]TRX69819.1 L-serine ammonia-lyase, iron-sulfur-dependent, subunit beta [Flammeovirga kamogawensis]